MSGATSVEIPGVTNPGTQRVYVTGGRYTTSWKLLYYGTFHVNPSVQAESAIVSIARTLNIDRLGYAVWDAVPYSFVADWFLPLGPLIDDALSGPAFYTFLSTPWLCSRQVETVSVQMSGNSINYISGSGDTGYKCAGTGSYGEQRKTFKRSEVNALDLATNSPNGMHGVRIVSGLALAWGRLR